MASANGHDKVTYLTAPIFEMVAYIVLLDFNLSLIATFFYIFSGLMFSGDLDIGSRQQNRWLFLKFIWKPYQRTFKHRSFFTHGIFIATAIRIIYLSLWVTIFLFIYKLIIFSIYGLNHDYAHYKAFMNNLSNLNFDNIFSTIKESTLKFINSFYIFYKGLVLKIWNYIILHKKESIVVFISLSLGSLSHTLADIVYSNVKATVKKLFFMFFPKKKNKKKK